MAKKINGWLDSISLRLHCGRKIVDEASQPQVCQPRAEEPVFCSDCHHRRMDVSPYRTNGYFDRCAASAPVLFVDRGDVEPDFYSLRFCPTMNPTGRCGFFTAKE